MLFMYIHMPNILANLGFLLNNKINFSYSIIKSRLHEKQILSIWSFAIFIFMIKSLFS